jgi:hypothetical protein
MSRFCLAHNYHNYHSLSSRCCVVALNTFYTKLQCLSLHNSILLWWCLIMMMLSKRSVAEISRYIVGICHNSVFLTQSSLLLVVLFLFLLLIACWCSLLLPASSCVLLVRAGARCSLPAAPALLLLPAPAPPPYY